MSIKKLEDSAFLSNIVAWLTSEDPDGIALDEKEKKHLEELQFVDNQIRAYKRSSRYIPLIMKTLSIGKAKAYRLVKETKLVFNSVEFMDKEYDRRMLYEMAMESYTMASAMRKPDVMIRAVREARELVGINGYQNELIDHSETRPHVFMFGFLPESLNVKLPADYKERAKELMERKQKVIDIGYE